MHVIPKHQTSVTLFGRDGSVRLFDTRSAALRELGASFIRYQAGPDFKTPRVPNHRFDLEWCTSFYTFVLVDDSGKAMSIADFEYLIPPRKPSRWSRDFGEYGVSHPGSKPSNGHYHRRPKTTAEKRMYSLVLSEDLEPPVRPSRSPSNLVDTWDDVYLHREKSWKRHRKTQYKETGMF
jgi:hypothetical protein